MFLAILKVGKCTSGNDFISKVIDEFLEADLKMRKIEEADPLGSVSILQFLG